MKFHLIDYQPRGRQINRDQTGTYGSHFHSGGLVGTLLSRVKSRGVRLPIVSFSYAASLLRAAGHTVTVVSGETAGEADVAVFATVMYFWKEDVEFIRAYKADHPGTKVGVVGAFSDVKSGLYKEVCDFIVHGELEGAILAFLDGKWAWEGDFNNDRDFVDFGQLPLPDWKGFPLSDYSYAPLLTKGNFLPVQSSRGCAFACKFCPYIFSQGTKMRLRTPALVEEEVKMLHRDYGVGSILFRDILFGFPPGRGEEIVERLSRLDLGIEWGCEMRVDSLSEGLIGKMAGAGLKVINLGIETPEPDILRESGKKPIDIEKLTFFVKRLHDYGVKVQAFYMLGLPQDTPETMRRTVEFAGRLNTFSAQFCVATPFPGTAYFEEVKDRLIHRDWSKYTEYTPVLNIPHAAADDVVKARDMAFRTYYLRPRWLLRHGREALQALLKGRIS